MMKLNKKTFGAVIFTALGLLLFLSKTIYTHNMPEITGTRPKRGNLSKLEISSGIAGWAETDSIYAVAPGAVGRVFVKEGDQVAAGQALFEMDFDLPAAERKLLEIQNNTGKLEGDLRSTRSRLDNIREALAAADDPERAAKLSGQAGLIALEINKARLALQNTELTFSLGAASKNDLVTAENSLKSLFFKYEAELEELEFSLAAKSADLQNLRLAEEAAREILRDYRNNAVIRAGTGGTILNLPVEKGKYFAANALLVSIGVGSEFTVECSISLDNNFVNSGDSCELSNSSHVLTGIVQRVKPSAHGKAVSISVVSGEVSDGETFDVTFEKNSTAVFTLVPNGAINQDNNGYFIYQIKRRKGIMGEEYYLERVDIYLGESDRNNTAVIRGITFFEPIVLASSRVLSDGLVVSLTNPEDFFEN